MEKDINEILFNKSGKNNIIAKKANHAKKLIQLLREHDSQGVKVPEAIINLYTKKIQNSTTAIRNKMEEDKLRPFEFYIIQN